MTWWAYIVVFDDSIHRKNMIDALDTMSGVGNWYACMPNAVFAVSNVSAGTLSKRIREAIEVKHLIVLDMETDHQGWLPKKAWEFINTPRPVRSYSED